MTAAKQHIIREYLTAGLSVMPTIISEGKKDKAPLEVIERSLYKDKAGYGTSWQSLRKQPIQSQDVDYFFSGHNTGIGLLGGFDGICVIDIDAYNYTKYLDKEATPFSFLVKVLDKLWITYEEDLCDKLTIQRSKSGGFHFIFRYYGDISTISSKLSVIGKKYTKENQERDLIDFRKSGYICIEPTPDYEVIQGDLRKIKTLNEAEFIYLIEALKSFDLREAAVKNRKEAIKREKIKASVAPITSSNERIPTWDIVNAYVAEIERNKVNITDGVLGDWFIVGCALAYEFGNKGKELFHRVARQHPDYNFMENERHYARCLAKCERSKIKIGSFIRLCKINHVEIEKAWFKNWYEANRIGGVVSMNNNGIDNLLPNQAPLTGKLKQELRKIPIAKGVNQDDKPLSPQQQKEQKLSTMLQEVLPFDPKTQLVKPPAVLSVINKYGNKQGIALEGGLVAIVGKQKSMKTTVLLAMIISKFRGPFLNFHLEIKGKILFFDTEQSKYEFHDTMSRLYRLAGLRGSHPLLECYNIAGYSKEDRVAFIDFKIRNTQKVGCVVIDGIKDICTDWMDSKSADETMEKVKFWQSGEDRNLLIITVLHLTKGVGNMRGFLGTELQNKCSFSIEVARKTEMDNLPHKVVSVIRTRDARSFAPFAEYIFYRGKDGDPHLDKADDEVEQPEEVEGLNNDLPF